MCKSPHLIPNPNYGRNPLPGTPMALKDCTSTYIPIPCGHCDECIAVKQMYIVQRVQMEALVNHVFFCTITYNNEMLPELVTSSGHTIRYTSYDDLKNMFKHLRRDNAFGVPFRYFAVTERGSKRARPHAHILFFIRKNEGDDYYTVVNLERLMFHKVLEYWSRNVGTNRKPVYKPLCTYIRKFVRGKLKSTYDLHYVNPKFGDDSCTSVAFYVLKYMLKSSDHDTCLQQALRLNYSDEEYRDIWKLVRSRSLCSKGFGLAPSEYVSRRGLGAPDPKIMDYLRDGVSYSKDTDFEFPLFYNMDSGDSFPLAPYYKSRGDIYSFDDALHFYFKSPRETVDSPIDTIDYSHMRNKSDDLKDFHRSAFIHRVSDELCDADSFDELFE